MAAPSRPPDPSPPTQDAPPAIRSSDSSIRGAQRFSMSYVTGTHNIKVGVSNETGFNDESRSRNNQINCPTTCDGLNYDFLNAKPLRIQYYALPFLGHGGDIPGFASTFAVFPSTGFGIVVLSNRDALRPVGSIRLALESFGGLPEPSTPPPGREVDPSRFASYAGRFLSRDGVRVDILHDGTNLRIESDLLASLGLPYEPVLEPTSLDNFALWVEVGGARVPLEVTFLPGEHGQYEWFRSRVAVAQRSAPTFAQP